MVSMSISSPFHWDALCCFLYFSGILGSDEQLTTSFKCVSKKAFVPTSSIGIMYIRKFVSQFSKSSYVTPKCLRICIKNPMGLVEKERVRDGSVNINPIILNTLSTMAFAVSTEAMASPCISFFVAIAVISSLTRLS